jgi:hypothetical protein
MIYDLVTVPREAVAGLFRLYDLYWNEVGGWDPGDELVNQGFASLVDNQDYRRLEDACLAIEPFEEQLAQLVAERPEAERPEASESQP